LGGGLRFGRTEQGELLPRLAALEEVIGSSSAAARIEAMLPAGVRPRQLSIRVLLAGICLTQADGGPPT
jgi:hypothetical protein